MTVWILGITRTCPLAGEISDTVSVGAESAMGARLTALATWPQIVTITSTRKEFEDENGEPLSFGRFDGYPVH
jgi:hypothetical protein